MEEQPSHDPKEGSKRRALPRWAKPISNISRPWAFKRLKRSERATEPAGTTVPLETGTGEGTIPRQYSTSRGQFSPRSDSLVRPGAAVVPDGFYGETLKNIPPPDARVQRTLNLERRSAEPFCLSTPEPSARDVRESSFWSNYQDGYSLAAPRRAQPAPIFLPAHDQKSASARYLEACRPPGVPRPPQLCDMSPDECQQGVQATRRRTALDRGEEMTSSHSFTSQQTSLSLGVVPCTIAYAPRETFCQEPSKVQLSSRTASRQQTRAGGPDTTAHEGSEKLVRATNDTPETLHEHYEGSSSGASEHTLHESQQRKILQHEGQAGEEIDEGLSLCSGHDHTTPQRLAEHTSIAQSHIQQQRHSSEAANNVQHEPKVDEYQSHNDADSKSGSEPEQDPIRPRPINFSYPRRTQI